MRGLLWYLHKVARKATCLLRGLCVFCRYPCKNVPIVYGGVQIDCPNVEFGRNVTLYPNVHVFGSGKLTIGDDVVIGDGTAICTANAVSIGNDTMIAAQSYIIDCNHGMHMGLEMRKQPMSIKRTVIGCNCWIGCGAKILAGATIADGVIVGAGSIVDSDLKANAIYYNERNLLQKKRI